LIPIILLIVVAVLDRAAVALVPATDTGSLTRFHAGPAYRSQPRINGQPGEQRGPAREGRNARLQSSSLVFGSD
jgi:hypothetical protein